MSDVEIVGLKDTRKTATDIERSVAARQNDAGDKWRPRHEKEEVERAWCWRSRFNYST
jgi:hypothetical protein